jgi:hypothetical protein
VKSNTSKEAGDVFWLLHEVCMSSLLMLLAKGWTVYGDLIKQSDAHCVSFEDAFFGSRLLLGRGGLCAGQE